MCEKWELNNNSAGDAYNKKITSKKQLEIVKENFTNLKFLSKCSEQAIDWLNKNYDYL